MPDIKKHIEDCANYVFSKVEDYKGQESNDLYITENKEYSYYKYKGMTMGFEGFLLIYKAGIDIADIYYNGQTFSEYGKIKFIEWMKSKQ